MVPLPARLRKSTRARHRVSPEELRLYESIDWNAEAEREAEVEQFWRERADDQHVDDDPEPSPAKPGLPKLAQALDAAMDRLALGLPLRIVDTDAMLAESIICYGSTRYGARVKRLPAIKDPDWRRRANIITEELEERLESEVMAARCRELPRAVRRHVAEFLYNDAKALDNFRMPHGSDGQHLRFLLTQAAARQAPYPGTKQKHGIDNRTLALMAAAAFDGKYGDSAHDGYSGNFTPSDDELSRQDWQTKIVGRLDEMRKDKLGSGKAGSPGGYTAVLAWRFGQLQRLRQSIIANRDPATLALQPKAARRHWRYLARSYRALLVAQRLWERWDARTGISELSDRAIAADIGLADHAGVSRDRKALVGVGWIVCVRKGSRSGNHASQYRFPDQPR